MRPYARKGKKIRVNNRKKFASTRGKVSRDYSPAGYHPSVSPLYLMLKRYERITKQGLSKKQRNKYADAML